MADTVSKSERSRIMALVKSKNTTPELVVRRLIHRMGFRFRLHVADLPGKPDIVLPRLRKIIHVSGCFWHMHGCGRCRIPATRRAFWIGKLIRNKARDQKNRRELRRLGWDQLTIYECQIEDKKRLLTALTQFLRTR